MPGYLHQFLVALIVLGGLVFFPSPSSAESQSTGGESEFVIKSGTTRHQGLTFTYNVMLTPKASRREGEPGRSADDGRVPHLHPPHRAQGLLVLGGEVPLQLQRHDRPHRKQRLGRVPA